MSRNQAVNHLNPQFVSRQASSLLKIAVATSLASLFVVQSAMAEDLKGDAVRAAKDKTSMCIGCHGIPGYKASFPNVYSVPKIGGQSEKYLVNSLNAYKKGERNHPSMKGIAWTLSDQDIADLAAYYAAGVSKPAAK